MLSFSAVLLVGGKSSRMGCDKALLPIAESNLLLWQRQLQTLEALHPEEIFWSGPSRPGQPEHVRVVADEIPSAGPLAGITACLGTMRSQLLVVLAIDMPQMTSSFLKDLQHRCLSSQGIVPRQADYYEPLAAIYPKGLHAAAQHHLHGGRYALQDLVREAIKREMVQAYNLCDREMPLFRNWNRPA